MDLETTLGRIEAKLLLIALSRANWKKNQAAQLLRISYSKLRYKIQKYGIEARERARPIPKRFGSGVALKGERDYEAVSSVFAEG